MNTEQVVTTKWAKTYRGIQCADCKGLRNALHKPIVYKPGGELDTSTKYLCQDCLRKFYKNKRYY